MRHQIVEIPENLNENEQSVLIALADECEKNGYDFGFSDEIELPEGITKNMIPGYVSQLSQKGYIISYSDDPEWRNGFQISRSACKVLGLDQNCAACDCFGNFL